MSLHGLLSVTIGVPNVEETAAYYTDFGLAPAAGLVQHGRRRTATADRAHPDPSAGRAACGGRRRGRPRPGG